MCKYEERKTFAIWGVCHLKYLSQVKVLYHMNIRKHIRLIVSVKHSALNQNVLCQLPHGHAFSLVWVKELISSIFSLLFQGLRYANFHIFLIHQNKYHRQDKRQPGIPHCQAQQANPEAGQCGSYPTLQLWDQTNQSVWWLPTGKQAVQKRICNLYMCGDIRGYMETYTGRPLSDYCKFSLTGAARTL